MCCMMMACWDCGFLDQAYPKIKRGLFLYFF